MSKGYTNTVRPRMSEAEVAALPPALTVKEAASVLGVSDLTARRMITRGDIPARKVGARWVVSKAGLLACAGLDEVDAKVPGTCELELNTDMTAVRCDACGYEMPRGTVLMSVNYCPNCGRRVERGEA